MSAPATQPARPSDTLPPVRATRRGVSILLTFHYAVVAVLCVQSLLLVPLYLKYIPVDLYGSWLGLSNFVFWIALLNPNVLWVASRKFATIKDGGQLDDLRAELASSTAATLVSLVVPVLVVALSETLAGWFPLPAAERAELASVVRWLALSIGLGLLEAPFAAVVRGTQRQVSEGATLLVGTLLALGTTAGLLRHGYGLRSLPIGFAVQNSFSFIVNIAIGGRWLDRGRVARALADLWRRPGETWRAYRPGMLNSVANGLRTQVSLFLVAKLLSPESSAIFYMTGQAFLLVARVLERTVLSALPSLTRLGALQGSVATWSTVERKVRPLCGFLAFVGVGSALALDRAFLGVWVGEKWYGGFYLAAAMAADAFVSSLFWGELETYFALGVVDGAAETKAIEGLLRLLGQLAAAALGSMTGVACAGCLATLLTRWFALPRLSRQLDKPLRSERLWFLPALIGVCLLGAAGNELLRRFGAAGMVGFLGATLAIGAVATICGAMLFPAARSLANWRRRLRE